jgi:hypothetical protein
MVSRQRPVVIQSLFPAINEEEPPLEEIEQYSRRLLELKNAGAQISLVQIYSATRPSPNSESGHLLFGTIDSWLAWNLSGGRLHVTVGAADSFYLEEAVYLLQAVLDSATDPPANATFEYGARKPHCWTGYSRERPGEDLSQAEFVRIAGEYLKR